MCDENTGIIEQSDGTWSFRLVVFDKDNKRHDIRKNKDDKGNLFKTRKAAAKAREEEYKKWLIINNEVVEEKPKNSNDITVEELVNEYIKTGRSSKAYGTIKKQDSLWKIHLKDNFGSKKLIDITSSEVNEYLSNLYYIDGYSYKYVEGFLKQFYLIFGQAFSKDYITSERYSKLCRNRDTKITMPKMKVDEDEDIRSFSKEELDKLDKYFKGTNGETAYMLGRYCGLRINECYGLTWDCVDLDNGTIRIEKQMQYQDGVIKLVPLKTKNAKRTVYISDVLNDYLKKEYKERKNCEKKYQDVRKQKEMMIPLISENSTISSLNLVNIINSTGKIQTVNSMKFHSKKIKDTLGIDFKYHYLRHTYGTRLATINTPQHLLCNQMGHSNIKITGKYYIGISKEGIECLKENINLL